MVTLLIIIFFLAKELLCDKAQPLTFTIQFVKSNMYTLKLLFQKDIKKIVYLLGLFLHRLEIEYILCLNFQISFFLRLLRSIQMQA